VTRIALWVSLAVLPAFCADSQLDRVLKGVEARYNRAKTLEVSFNETYTTPGRPRQAERGELTLRKPGRMRWDYTSPAGKLFLSDGKDVYLYTPEGKRVEKMRLKESEDMRAPLAFLLGKLDFAKEFRNFAMAAEGDAYRVTAGARNEKLPYDKIDMLVGPTFEIRKLVVTGQDRSILTFQFEHERLNPPVDDARFQFRMPAGATLVNTEAGQ
jgi:outer membrane lipoprotein carrier protein